MPTDPERVETVAMSQAPSRTPSPHDGRFLPGTLLASRYRIISRLGEGGMGEVFRADDLVLGQPVALKFLPESAKGNENLLTRFYDEVRITRQISHANVCRVYDIGEADGHLFLSMEYIDGEDLRGLLRRIGRLPGDKALEFARKLCAGLAAAHTRGVLHRDLKPANIMIDARGELRVTDFGLAAVAQQLKGPEARHGTPAYMAPEQLEGREVTAQSDIYALGLVLYEMFTGKAPFANADSAAEMLRLRKESRITNPSTVISDLDPAVERAILRCLDPDPKSRPASALDLARSLPGGDPLAAALAAGETPSPDVVAASGSTGALRPVIAIGLLAVFAASLIGYCVLLSKLTVVDALPLEYPPDALVAKAREIARTLGYAERPVDSASGFGGERGYSGFMEKKTSGIEAWKRVAAAPPSPVTFWYRQSPGLIVSDSINGYVTSDSPVPRTPGEVGLTLDSEGRLREFSAVPQQLETAKPPAIPLDWAPLFAAARLDMAQLRPAEPQWTPLASTDARAAWTGFYPGRDDLPIRVEGAAFHGRPVYFQIVWPWTAPDRVPRQLPAQALVGFPLLLALVGVAAMLARHNWKTGRGDFRGAARLAVFDASTVMLYWVLIAHHVASILETATLASWMGIGLLLVASRWTLYVALEPWVRRHWPHSLITWSRVLAGRFRDPLVGRDLLLGSAVGGISALVSLYAARSVSFAGPGPASNLRGAGYLTMVDIGTAVLGSLALFLVLFLLRMLLRNQWLAAAVLVLIMAALNVTLTALPERTPAMIAGQSVLLVGTVLFMMRFGLFATIVGFFASTLILEIQTSNFTAWYGQGSVLFLALVSALALWGFRTSLGGQKVFSGAALEK